MATKICKTCQQEKPTSAFAHHARNRDRLQGSCKACQAESARASYRRNPQRQRSNVAARLAEARSVVDSLKSNPCTDCGLSFPPVCMDFDHLGEKFEGIARMVRRGFALNKILAEIAKCELVCANCHRLRTATRGENVAIALRQGVA